MQREIILVLGQAGCGKTTWANHYIGDELRTIIVDAGFGEFKAAETKTVEELIQYLEARNSNGAGFFKVSYTPRPSELDTIFDVAMAVNRNDAGEVVNESLLVIEEANVLGEPEPESVYEYALVKGRHDGLSIMAVTLYPSLLSIKLRSQSTRLVLFHQDEPAHLKYIEGKVGREIASQLRDLDKFEFIDWNQGEWRKMRIHKAGENISLHPLT